MTAGHKWARLSGISCTTGPVCGAVGYDANSGSVVARSADHFEGWGDVVIFAACTAARIGEVSGIRCADIDRDAWTWTVRWQTTPADLTGQTAVGGRSWGSLSTSLTGARSGHVLPLGP